MMFTHYRSRGIILDKRNRGEADQLFTVFTEDFGMIEVLGRAIRKTSSKLRAGMEVFYLSEVEFIEGKFYKTLTDAVAQKKFFSSSSALQNLSLAWRIAEFAQKLGSPQEDRIIFFFLKRIFEDLQTPLPKEKQSLFLSFFLWSLASLMGYKPELSVCVRCSRSLQTGAGGFALQEGGAVCRSCFLNIPKQDRIAIRLDSVKLIRFFLSHPWHEVKKLRLQGAPLRELRGISLSYFRSLAYE